MAAETDDGGEVDSAGVYFMTVEEFESRPKPEPRQKPESEQEPAPEPKR